MEREYSDIESIRILLNILIQKNINKIVISPGSRNAPLTISIARQKEFKTYVITDERSAAFFALGMAQQSGEPVVLVCTSGTALLNYTPAIAESYYAGIPLLIVSADRPQEWINQDDCQTITQNNLLTNIVKESFQFPCSIQCDDQRWYVNRMVNQAIDICLNGHKGPVHVNIPLREPLYNFNSYKCIPERIFQTIENDILSSDDLNTLKERLRKYEKIIIVAGFQSPNEHLNKTLEKLSNQKNITILVENVSNIHSPKIITTVDRLISSIPDTRAEQYSPQLLITFGGSVISRMLKAFIRNNKPLEHWHIDERQIAPDTYKSLTHHIKCKPSVFLEAIAESDFENKSDYSELWQELNEKAAEKHEEFLNSIEWCDFKAFSIIIPEIPANSRLQLANSTPVRYAQLFRFSHVQRVDSNRGTSGIDGCTSTALGAAQQFDGITTLITGDNSLLYDSNALWNAYKTPNFKIICIQNDGGGIFHFLEGSSTVVENEQFFQANHRVDLQAMAKAYDLEVFMANDSNTLKEKIKEFYNYTLQPSILIIKTSGKESGAILKSYFKYLKTEV